MPRPLPLASAYLPDHHHTKLTLARAQTHRLPVPARPLHAVRFLISSVLLPPPPATPPPTRTHAHGRTHGLAARGRRPPPRHLLLRRRLHLQELQALFVFAPAPPTPVSSSADNGARGGGGAPAAGGAPSAGRAGRGRRAGHPRGHHRRAAAPGRHGRPLRLHALGGVPRLAVAPRAHRPGRDHRAQKAAQTRRRSRRRRRSRGLRRRPARRQVAHGDQDRGTHRGAEEAGEGVVQGPALQRGLHPAGAGRHGVRRRRAQHLAPHWQALPGPAPLRRGRHHRALGGRRRARPRHAEGERDRKEPAHRSQHHQRPALRLADPHRARDRRQGLRVHKMAMSSQELFASSSCLSVN